MKSQQDFPLNVWVNIASHDATPFTLQRLAHVNRNARIAATSNKLWKPFTPYDIDDQLYSEFLERIKDYSKEQVRTLRSCWEQYIVSTRAHLSKITGISHSSLQFISVPEKPFEFHQFDLALAYTSIQDSNDATKFDRVLFGECLQHEAFLRATITINPGLYLKLDEIHNNLELATLAVRGHPQCWKHAPQILKEDLDLVKASLLPENSSAFLHIYSRIFPCQHKEVILQCTNALLEDEERWGECIEPSLLTQEFCQTLALAGVPIYDHLPDLMYDRDFILNYCRTLQLPSIFANDREVALSFLKRNGYELRNVSESLRQDKEVVCTALRENIAAIKFCNKSVLTSPEFIKEFESIVLEIDHPHQVELPLELQSREIALKAVKRSGMWLRSFTKYQQDMEIISEAVRTYPMCLQLVSDDTLADEDLLRLCKINPVCIWKAGRAFREKNGRLLRDALRHGPPNYLYEWNEIITDRNLLLHAVESHPENFKNLVRRFPKYYNDKEVVLAALDRCDGSILWNLSPKLMKDSQIWSKARLMRK